MQLLRLGEVSALLCGLDEDLGTKRIIRQCREEQPSILPRLAHNHVGCESTFVYFGPEPISGLRPVDCLVTGEHVEELLGRHFVASENVGVMKDGGTDGNLLCRPRSEPTRTSRICDFT